MPRRAVCLHSSFSQWLADSFFVGHRYTLNRQPGKALPFFLRLRRPNVFDLIRESNLFTDVQDQALLLVEFDQELREKRKREGEDIDTDPVAAITLLVDHIHSIPVRPDPSTPCCVSDG